MATLYTVQVSASKVGGKKLVDFFFSLSNTFTELFCNVHLKTPFIGHKQLTKYQIIILMLVVYSSHDHAVSVTDFSFLYLESRLVP